MRKVLVLTISTLFLFSMSVNAQMRSFVGNWVNTNSNTSGMTRVRVTANGNRAFIHAWGQCTPRDCDWGRTSATKFYTGVSSNTVSGLMGSYSETGIRRMVILKMLRGNILQAQVLKTFSVGNRQNTIQTYTFRKVRLAPLRTPVLVSPRNNERFTNFPRRTTLDWRPVSGATAYGVEVEYYDRSRRRWIGNYKSATVNRTGYTFDFIGDQPGRWRVWSIRGNRVSRKSAWRTFSYRTASAVLRAPVQVSPRNGIVYNRFPRTTTLTWRPVAGAGHYMVEIEYFANGRWIGNYKLDRSNDTRHVFRFVGAQPGRWRVWAVNSRGVAGRKSGWRTFRYTR